MAVSLRQKEQLYHDLGQLSESGVSLGRSLEILSKNAWSPTSRRTRRIGAELRRSHAVSAAFIAGGVGLDDAAVLEAGEQTGRLPEVFAELSHYYGQLADMRRQVIARSLYPLFVYHLGAVLLSVPPAVLGGGWPVFVRSALTMLCGLYIVLSIVIVGAPVFYRLFSTSVLFARIFSLVPLIGRFLTDWAGWKFASVLALFVRSGGGVLRGFQVAGRVGGNADTASCVAKALSLVQQGGRFSEALRGHVPEPLERALQLGEETGRLDAEITRAAEILKARTLHSLELITEWTPRILYLAISLSLAWRIIQTALQIAGSVQTAIDSASF